MKIYKITYEYRGTVTVEVEAETEKLAEIAGLEDADKSIGLNLTVYDITTQEKNP